MQSAQVMFAIQAIRARLLIVVDETNNAEAMALFVDPAVTRSSTSRCSAVIPRDRAKSHCH